MDLGEILMSLGGLNVMADYVAVTNQAKANLVIIMYESNCSFFAINHPAKNNLV